ncbi:hypothetical protein AAG570_006280, partial [Ranatra chinensis]
LPQPVWSPLAPKTIELKSVEHYEELALTIELTVQQLLRDHTYNTVGNFLRFYKEYRGSDEWDLKRFLRQYRPIITDGHHTCVGLGLEAIERLHQLEARWSQLAGALQLVSCEEAVEDTTAYTASPYPPSHIETEKEHVLVCAHISVAGRRGVLLLDPGYHVARVITVMEDGLYPHSGWFTQTDEGTVKKEYMYAFGKNKDYVVWEVAETRGHAKKAYVSLIYVARAFFSAVDVTERRNLVYDFRSWLGRDTKGQITAGIYFSIPDGIALDGHMFTLLYTDPLSSVKHRLKLNFSSFLNQVII